MRQTRLPAADRGIWIPGGGRRRVRARRGDGDPFFDARGTTLAIAHDVFGPQRTLSVAPQFSQPDIQQKELLRGYEILGRAGIALSASEINRRILWLKIPRSGVRRQPG